MVSTQQVCPGRLAQQPEGQGHLWERFRPSREEPGVSLGTQRVWGDGKNTRSRSMAVAAEGVQQAPALLTFHRRRVWLTGSMWDSAKGHGNYCLGWSQRPARGRLGTAVLKVTGPKGFLTAQ